MSNVYLKFPKVIYKDTLSCLNDTLIDQYKKYIDSDLTRETEEYNGLFTKNQFILDDPIFNPIRAELITHVMNYIKILSHKVNSIEITSSWANVIDKNNAIYAHYHGNSYISGVFYLTDGSPLAFHNDHVYEQFTFSPEIEVDKDKPWTFTSVSYPAETGNIILFPSLMKHSVHKPSTDEKRYSIAFNTIPTGMIGSITNKVHIKRDL